MEARLYILSSGYQTIAKQKLLSTAGKDEKIDIPVPYFLLDLGKEKILIDSGIAKQENSSAGLSVIKDAQDPIQSLSKLGISREEITYIIHTHLHFDHAANTKLFPNASVIVQLEELRAAFFPNPGIKHGYVEQDIKHPGIKWKPIVGVKSMFDNNVLIIPTPGHTPGHQSILIRLKNHSPVIIAGDVAPLKDNVELGIPPGVASNPYEALYSIQSLKEFASFERAEIWYGHDPSFFKESKMAPEYYD